jgi:heat shock protein HslJ
MNTHIILKPAFATLVSALMLAACKVEVPNEDEGTAVPEMPALQGTAWWVEDIAGKGVIDASHTTIDFTQEEQVAGDTGCNRYFGSVEIGEGRISFGALAGTRKACAESLMNQEMSFYQAMDRAANWEIADTGLLHLRDAEGNDQIRASATDDP